MNMANLNKSHKHSEEWKQKLRERMLGNKLGLGYRHTEEHKKKISEANRKRYALHPETFGHKHSEETKKKMSLSRLGNPHRCSPHVKYENLKHSAQRRKRAPRPKPEQCDVCMAFGKDFKYGLMLDHDHATGKFRGWLCTRCNAALGMVGDNSETLLALVEYLRKSR